MDAFKVTNNTREGRISAFFDIRKFTINTDDLRCLVASFQQNADIFDATWNLGAGHIELRYNPVLKNGETIKSELEKFKRLVRLAKKLEDAQKSGTMLKFE